MIQIVTGKKLQVRVDDKQQRIVFCRYCQTSEKYLKFQTIPFSVFGDQTAALVHAKNYIKSVECLTDGELKVEVAS